MVLLHAAVGRAQPNLSQDARLVQQLLNRFRPAGEPLLKVDALIGVYTVAAIEEFQQRVVGMTRPDGVVSPGGATLKALCSGQTDTLLVAWGARVSVPFKQKTIDIADMLSIPIDFLMSAMAFESGETFSASVKNGAGSGAVGLIQFMPATARHLGTTTERLAGLSNVDQLDYVQRYLRPYAGAVHSLEDLYMSILYPAAIGRSPSSVLFEAGSAAYRQNKGLDVNRDNRITVHEASSKVFEKFRKGLGPGFLG